MSDAETVIINDAALADTQDTTGVSGGELCQPAFPTIFAQRDNASFRLSEGDGDDILSETDDGTISRYSVDTSEVDGKVNNVLTFRRYLLLFVSFCF
jgi:hypothetical protein